VVNAPVDDHGETLVEVQIRQIAALDVSEVSGSGVDEFEGGIALIHARAGRNSAADGALSVVDNRNMLQGSPKYLTP